MGQVNELATCNLGLQSMWAELPRQGGWRRAILNYKAGVARGWVEWTTSKLELQGQVTGASKVKGWRRVIVGFKAGVGGASKASVPAASNLVFQGMWSEWAGDEQSWVSGCCAWVRLQAIGSWLGLPGSL